MVDALRNTPLLSRLGEQQLQRVSTRAVHRTLDEGQWLFRQGDPARRFYLVVEGQLRLFRLSPEGTEKVIEIVSPGQTFAEALMFLNAPRYPVCEDRGQVLYQTRSRSRSGPTLPFRTNHLGPSPNSLVAVPVG